MTSDVCVLGFVSLYLSSHSAPSNFDDKALTVAYVGLTFFRKTPFMLLSST